MGRMNIRLWRHSHPGTVGPAGPRKRAFAITQLYNEFWTSIATKFTRLSTPFWLLSNRLKEEIITLVRTYHLSTSLVDRLLIGDDIIARILPDLQVFLLSAVPASANADVLQETIAAIAKGLSRFQGKTDQVFWAWVYQIARHKIADHFRHEASHLHRATLSIEDVRELVEGVPGRSDVSSEIRLDLEFAMQLLAESKPECREYLWNFFVVGLDYADIAGQQAGSYDGVRMKINRCLEIARNLLSEPA
jgi:RNA polymerase sigma factor (sigma-70 family)